MPIAALPAQRPITLAGEGTEGANRDFLRKKALAHVLLPNSARQQLNELPDDALTKVTLFYYGDLRGAVEQMVKFLVVTESVSDS